MKTLSNRMARPETYNRHIGNLFIFLNVFLLSFLGTATKTLELDSLLVVGITDFFSLLFQLVYFRKYRHVLNPLVLLTGLIYSVSYLSFLLGVQYGTVTNTIVLQYCSPVYVALLQHIFLRQKAAKGQVLAILGCMAGLIWFFGGQLEAKYLLGNLFGLISGVMYALSFLFSAHPKNHPPTAGIAGSIGCCLIGVFYLATNGIPLISGKDMGIMIFVGLIINGCSSVLYAKGIGMTTALSANIISISEVFMAPLWAFLFLGERIPLGGIPGILLMLLSICYEVYLECRTPVTSIGKSENTLNSSQTAFISAASSEIALELQKPTDETA